MTEEMIVVNQAALDAYHRAKDGRAGSKGLARLRLVPGPLGSPLMMALKRAQAKAHLAALEVVHEHPTEGGYTWWVIGRMFPLDTLTELDLILTPDDDRQAVVSELWTTGDGPRMVSMAVTYASGQPSELTIGAP